MQRLILTYGLIAGVVVGIQLFLIVTLFGDNPPTGPLGMALGYLTMLIALSAVFVAIKRRRDHDLGGAIRFWPALGLGVAISAVAGGSVRPDLGSATCDPRHRLSRDDDGGGSRAEARRGRQCGGAGSIAGVDRGLPQELRQPADPATDHLQRDLPRRAARLAGLSRIAAQPALHAAAARGLRRALRFAARPPRTGSPYTGRGSRS
eukprot:Opistho-1_new@108603